MVNDTQAPTSARDDDDLAVAIIGMAGRFPGASSVEAFWDDLRQGRDVMTRFPELERPDVAGRHYVAAGYVLDDIAGFDADFFAMTPREASLADPQQRLFLECAWEALERAGYVDERHGTIGVYASANFNSYLFHVCRATHYENVDRHFEVILGNDKDYLATRVSYKLNLTGPSVVVQSACSSSLVGVSMAAQALLNEQCDLIVVGGAGLRARQRVGYWASPEEGLLSPDGRVRPFDERGNGFIEGNGVGAVVLKRLRDAVADRDTIHAVVRGFAVNNDGAGKVSYMAPSVAGQSSAIAEAVAVASIDPATVSYIEAHGTGTAIGDPIEAEALGRVYGRAAGVRCALGSVKSNIGHLDAAAGIASLIKTALCLEHRYLPGTLHVEVPNPKARLDELGFHVPTRGADWPASGQGPRRAAVSSLGIGGTNAHVVLEEPPRTASVSDDGAPHLLPLSARTSQALEATAERLASWLAANPAARLTDVAYTLQMGRKSFAHRRFVVVRDRAEAIGVLTDPQRFRQATVAAAAPSTSPAGREGSDRAAVLTALGERWLAGAAVDWVPLWQGQTQGGRIPLPTYPFERQRHWVDGPDEVPAAAGAKEPPGASALAVETGRAPAPAPAGGRKERPPLTAPPEPPRDDLERTILDMWQDAFGIEPLGIHDNFRDLGGESLVAMPLVTRIRETFHVKLPIVRFFGAPTVARLTQHILEIEETKGRAMRIATALQKVKRMDPEQVKKALEAAKKPAPGGG